MGAEADGAAEADADAMADGSSAGNGCEARSKLSSNGAFMTFADGRNPGVVVAFVVVVPASPWVLFPGGTQAAAMSAMKETSFMGGGLP
jgi:hypothetical protein